MDGGKLTTCYKKFLISLDFMPRDYIRGIFIVLKFLKRQTLRFVLLKLNFTI